MEQIYHSSKTKLQEFVTVYMLPPPHISSLKMWFFTLVSHLVIDEDYTG